MIRMCVLIILLLLDFNLKSNEKIVNIYHLKLTTLSEKILDMFISDPMNNRKLDSLSCSIVMSFRGIHDTRDELWIYDAELLNSCIDHIYMTKHKGFNIFYKGKILPKYIYRIKDYKKLECMACDSLLNTFPKDKQVVFSIYDGSIFKIKKGSTFKNMKIEKVGGG